MDKLLSIGKILNFHGVKGEVKVGYSRGKEEQLEQLETVYAFKGSASGKITLTIENIRFHKSFAIIKFKEINSINESAEFKGANLKIEKSKLTELLEKDEYYIEDLVGLDAYTTEDEFIGKVKFVAEQGSGYIIGIRDKDKKEHLIPFIENLVPEVSLKDKKIVINPIPGLLTLGDDDNEEE